MSVKLVFLGKLADLAGTPEKTAPAPLDWKGLIDTLSGPLAETVRGEKVKLALNGAVLPDKSALAANDGDEIALLPPVSGG